jgi:triacylglycerol lipase
VADDAMAHDPEAPGSSHPVGRVLRRGADLGDSARRTAGRGARAVLSPHSVRGAALEVAWIGAHLALYPLGALREKARVEGERFGVATLPPVQRGLVIGDVEAAGTPILLVHGMVDNRSIFTMLRRGLRRRGFGRVIALNYSPLTGDVRDVAAQLGELVEEVCAETGYERIHVVGHSMGGMVARYYVQRLGGDDRVHTLVTLGTPHGGTFPARLFPHPLLRQLRPGSDVVAELTEPAPTCRTRFVAIWSDLDQMVVPKRSATIDHPDLSARNVFVRGVGHMSLPVDGRVVHEICTTLAHLDHDGQTVVVGVTPITSTTPERRGERRPARRPTTRRLRTTPS